MSTRSNTKTSLTLAFVILAVVMTTACGAAALLQPLIRGVLVVQTPESQPTADPMQTAVAMAVATMQAAAPTATALPPTATPTATATATVPPPTATHTPSLPPPTNTPSPMPTLTPTPLPTVTPPVALKTYSSLGLGLSVDYPVTWEVEKEEEDMVAFSAGGTLSVAAVAKLADFDARLTGEAVRLLLALAIHSECDGAELQDRGLLVVDGMTWAETETTCPIDLVPYGIVVYSTVHADRAYLVLGGTPEILLETQRPVYRAMVESVRFDSAAPAAPAIGSLATILDRSPDTVETFAQDSGGWETNADEDAGRFYRDGALHIEVTTDSLVAWSSSDALVTDFYLEVDATRIAGPLDNEFGVIFRRVDNNNFYLFNVSSDGYYGLRMLVDDEWEEIIQWDRTDAIGSVEGSSNRLGVLARGPRISLYVNNTLLGEVADDTFSAGKIALAAGTFEEAGVEIAFDNLRLWRLASVSPAAELAQAASTPAATLRPPVLIPAPTIPIGLPPDAAVVAQALNVRAGPGTDYPVLAGVRRGDALTVLGQAADCGWLKVRTPRGTEGWVSGRPEYVALYLPCAQIVQAPIPPPPTAAPPPSRPTAAAVPAPAAWPTACC